MKEEVSVGGARSHMPVNPQPRLMCTQCVFASKPAGL